MSALVEDLRRMTAVEVAQYEVAGKPFWSDGALAEILGRHVCLRMLQAPVYLIETIDADSGLVFVNGRAPTLGTLDIESATVTTWTGSPIAGEVTVHDDGRIEFTENQATDVPVISGLCFDLNSAAADVLVQWAADLKLGYDIKSGEAELPRSQRHAMLLTQAETYRSRAVAGSGQMSRGDLRGHGRSSRSDAVRRSFARLGRPG
jgi:hypothetical protein